MARSEPEPPLGGGRGPRGADVPGSSSTTPSANHFKTYQGSVLERPGPAREGSGIPPTSHLSHLVQNEPNDSTNQSIHLTQGPSWTGPEREKTTYSGQEHELWNQSEFKSTTYHGGKQKPEMAPRCPAPLCPCPGGSVLLLNRWDHAAEFIPVMRLWEGAMFKGAHDKDLRAASRR